MPGSYAHYHFGLYLMEKMPPDQLRSVNRFRQLYDVGLHGPDILYYTDPLGISSNGKLGKAFHEQTGEHFFEHACRAFRLQPSEGGEVFLYGLLAHYALDSLTTPLIQKNVVPGKRSRRHIEAEFDRFLLTLDGRTPVHLYDGSRHLRLTAGEADVAAEFFPGVSGSQLQKCVNNMARSTRMLVMDTGKLRQLRLNSLALVAPDTAQRAIPVRSYRDCCALNQPLKRLMEELALKRYFALMDGMQRHLCNGAPLTPDFLTIFGE